jgi:hypothetical protein
MEQQPTSPAVPVESMVVNNPGQATGIIGVILAFVGLAPFGLILSIISTVQSKKANAPIVLGIIGVVINAIAVFVLAFLILIISTHYSGIQEAAKNLYWRSLFLSSAPTTQAFKKRPKMLTQKRPPVQ